MSQGLRYKFQGSTFQIQTGYSGASPLPAITNISQANPGVVTSTAHPFVTADVVRIAGVLGMTQLNSRLIIVDNELANSFEMAAENTSNNTAYISGGTLDEAVLSEFCELTGMNQQDGTSDELDATTICSTSKEFETGLGDSGSLTLDFNFAPATAVHTAMRAAKESGEDLAFKIVLSNSGGTIIMLGVVQQMSFQGAVSQLWTGSATIKLTGPIFVL